MVLGAATGASASVEFVAYRSRRTSMGRAQKGWISHRCPAPALADRTIFVAPGTSLERGQGGLGRGGGALNVLQCRGHRLEALPGAEVQAVPQQLHSTGLHYRPGTQPCSLRLWPTGHPRCRGHATHDETAGSACSQPARSPDTWPNPWNARRWLVKAELHDKLVGLSSVCKTENMVIVVSMR